MQHHFCLGVFLKQAHVSAGLSSFTSRRESNFYEKMVACADSTGDQIFAHNLTEFPNCIQNDQNVLHLKEQNSVESINQCFCISLIMPYNIQYINLLTSSGLLHFFRHDCKHCTRSYFGTFQLVKLSFLHL